MSSSNVNIRGSESPLTVLSATPSPFKSPIRDDSSDTIRVEDPSSPARSWAQVAASPPAQAAKATTGAARKVPSHSKSTPARNVSNSSSTTIPNDSPEPIAEEAKVKRARVPSKKAKEVSETSQEEKETYEPKKGPKKPVGRPQKQNLNISIDINESAIKVHANTQSNTSIDSTPNPSPDTNDLTKTPKASKSNGSDDQNELNTKSPGSTTSTAKTKPAGRKRKSHDDLFIDMNESATKVQGKRKINPPASSPAPQQPPKKKSRTSNGSTSTEKSESEPLFPALAKASATPKPAILPHKTKRKHENMDTEKDEAADEPEEYRKLSLPGNLAKSQQPPKKKVRVSDSSTTSEKNETVHASPNKTKRKRDDLYINTNDSPPKKPTEDASTSPQQPAKRKAHISDDSIVNEKKDADVLFPALSKAKAGRPPKRDARPAKGKRKSDPLLIDMKPSFIRPKEKAAVDNNTSMQNTIKTPAKGTRDSKRTKKPSPKAFEIAIANGEVAPFNPPEVKSKGAWNEPRQLTEDQRKTALEKQHAEHDKTGKSKPYKNKPKSLVMSVAQWKAYRAQAADLLEPEDYHHASDAEQDLGIDMNLSGGKSDEQEAEELKKYYENEMREVHQMKSGTYNYNGEDTHHEAAPESFARTIIPEPAHLTRKYEAEMVQTGKVDHLMPPFKKFWEEPPVVESDVRGKKPSPEEEAARTLMQMRRRELSNVRSESEMDAAAALLQVRYGGQ